MEYGVSYQFVYEKSSEKQVPDANQFTKVTLFSASTKKITRRHDE